MTMITDGQFISETASGTYASATANKCSLLLADGAVPDFDALATACKATVYGTRMFQGTTLQDYVQTTLARNILVKGLISAPVQFQKGSKLVIEASTAKDNPIVLKTGTPTWGILALRQTNTSGQLFGTAYYCTGLLLFTVGGRGSGMDVELSSVSALLTVDQVFKLGDISVAIQNLIT